MRLDTAKLTRRSLLAAALASSARWSPPAFASSIDERTREAAVARARLGVADGI